MAAVLILEPIFEVDLQPEQHAYRPDRSALDAVNAVFALVNSGHTEVVDADLSGYFDSIPHSELVKSLARRISDRHLLHLLKPWLEMPVEQGHERRLGACLVNYADDFVICCQGTAEEAMAEMRNMMSKLKLTVNEKKTRLCRLPEETFDFLGYTIGRCYSPKTGRAYLGTKPSRKKVRRICDAISERTGWHTTLLSAEKLVAQ